MKLPIIGLALATVASAALLLPASAQDGAPQRQGTTQPKRLGGKRLGGIKIKPEQGPLPAPVATPVRESVPKPVTLPAPAPEAPPGMGALTFEPGSQVVGFGDLVQGEVREGTFRLKSTGQDPLVISNVTKSCGCTRAELVTLDGEGKEQPYTTGEPIPIGTEVLIKAAIDTTGKSHAFKSDITLTTNDPRRGIVFSLTAQIKLPLALNPRSLNLGQLQSTEQKTGQIVVTSSAFGAFKLSVDATIPLNKCSVELIPTAPDEHGRSERWTVKLQAGPNLPEGALHQSVRLLTDLPRPGKTMADGSPQFYDGILFVTASVIGPVSVSPPHVSFGLMRPGQTLTRKARIRMRDPEFNLETAPSFELKGYGVELAHADRYTVSITPVVDSRDWEVSITVMGIELSPEDNGAFRGFVQIQLGHGSKSVLDIGFAGIVREAVSGS